MSESDRFKVCKPSAARTSSIRCRDCDYAQTMDESRAAAAGYHHVQTTGHMVDYEIVVRGSYEPGDRVPGEHRDEVRQQRLEARIGELIAAFDAASIPAAIKTDAIRPYMEKHGIKARAATVQEVQRRRRAVDRTKENER